MCGAAEPDLEGETKKPYTNHFHINREIGHSAATESHSPFDTRKKIYSRGSCRADNNTGHAFQYFVLVLCLCQFYEVSIGKPPHKYTLLISLIDDSLTSLFSAMTSECFKCVLKNISFNSNFEGKGSGLLMSPSPTCHTVIMAVNFFIAYQ